MVKLFFTYMVLCSDENLYVGVTNNVCRRVQEHNSDDFPESFCHTRRPVELIYVRTFYDSGEAIKFEKQIKKWSRRKKWALAMGDLHLVHKLAECRNETHFKYFKKEKKIKSIKNKTSRTQFGKVKNRLNQENSTVNSS